jgi:hypothetical protein
MAKIGKLVRIVEDEPIAWPEREPLLFPAHVEPEPVSADR